MTGYYIVRTPNRQTVSRLYNILLDLGQPVKESKLSDWVVRGHRYDDMCGVIFTCYNQYMCYISEEQIRTTGMPIITVEDYAAIVKVSIERTPI